MPKASRRFCPHCCQTISKTAYYDHRSLYFHNNQWTQTEDTSDSGIYVLKLISKPILVSSP